MSRLQVRRKSDNKTDSITGELFLDDTKLCNTLEPGSERPQHPAIPAGIYKLALVKEGEVYGWMKKKAQSIEANGVPLLENVPGRGGVEIHIGNSCMPSAEKPFGDSLGCLLLGQNVNDNTKVTGFLSGSTVAYIRNYPVLLDYIKNDPDGTIEYIDVPAEA